jgi:hypothetical protein
VPAVLRRGSGEQLKGEARLIDAFEDIGDTLLGIHHELVELRLQGKSLSARLTMKRES